MTLLELCFSVFLCYRRCLILHSQRQLPGLPHNGSDSFEYVVISMVTVWHHPLSQRHSSVDLKLPLEGDVTVSQIRSGC